MHHPFRGLLSVHSRYGLQTCQVASATLYTGGFSSFVASTAAPVATGWSEPTPGRDFHPLWISAFSRRTEKIGLESNAHLSRSATDGAPDTDEDSQNLAQPAERSVKGDENG